MTTEYEPWLVTAAENSSSAAPVLENYSNIGVDILPHSQAYDSVDKYLNTIIEPALCAFGFTGNILNILVLTRRRMQAAIDNKMERTACIGLISLAVSDTLYCACTFPGAMTELAMMYEGRTFGMYYQLYGGYLRNVLSYTSTWLTVIMAVSRYTAICHPLHARIFVNPGATKFTIMAAFVVWILLSLPEAWVWRLIVDDKNGTTIYYLTFGTFEENETLKKTFCWVWSLLGFVVPVSVLTFCNLQLIRALRESYRMRKECRVHGKAKQPASHITPTLIAIVMMFIIFVSPTEILNIISYMVDTTRLHHLELCIHLTNIMHTINFSMNFVLYCVVNVHFRATLKELLCCCIYSRKDRRRFKGSFSASYSNVTTKSVVPTSETPL